MFHSVLYFLIFALFLLGGKAQAQLTMHPMATVGYTYQNQNFGELGGKLLFLKKDEMLYRIGASALIGSVKGKISVIPKLQTDVLFNFSKGHSVKQPHYFVLGAEATNKFFSPKLGISAFGLIELSGGYAFPWNNQTLNGKTLKGVNFNCTFNIPLVVFFGKKS
ncbi:hypothetical protein SAMN05421544_10982 [Riemerella columbipharyngis]|uniref:Outer membrane protein beta-barrel domain-containing protein n=2 Tax=Riemerella columbipharyngis TaxID=1071918 RepID=A0A1G7CZR9_9FLAO|nr:hypothetical protein SAMN05421544_10982 [Riemerella columbipharyngis]